MFNYKLLSPQKLEVFYNEEAGHYEGYCKYCQTFHTFTVQEIGGIIRGICSGYKAFNPIELTGALLQPTRSLYKPDPRQIPISKVDALKKRRDKVLRALETTYKYSYFAKYPEAVPTVYLKDWERLIRTEDIFQWEYVFENIVDYGKYERFFMKLHDIDKAGKREKFLEELQATPEFIKNSKCYGR